MDARELLKAFEIIEREKGIPTEVVIEALKDALINAYNRDNPGALMEIEIDQMKGTITIFEIKNIVEEVEDDAFQIELEEAILIREDAKIGENIKYEVKLENLSRKDAMQVKQVFFQKIREFEKQSVYDSYIDKKDDIITAKVERIEPNFILLDVGKSKAIMKTNHSIQGETFKVGQNIRVYVVDVDKKAQGASVIVSRTVPGFLKRLFESEVHEVYDGTVEIKRIARLAGERSKVAVFSRNKDVDPAGACIGQRGVRIQKISSQIMGEKIDVIQYYKEPILFIAEALKPAEVLGVSFEEDGGAIAIVKDEDFSLAIGKKGLNVRLAVQLTNFKLDIKTLTEALNESIEYKTITQAKNEYETNKFLEEELDEVIIKEEKEEEEIVVEPKEEVKLEERIIEVPIIKKETIKPTIKPRIKPIVIPKAPTVEVVSSTRRVSRKKEEEKQEIKRTTISTKELEDLIKKRDEARSYMPVYTETELEELDSNHEKEDLYDEIDYEEYDDYYDED